MPPADIFATIFQQTAVALGWLSGEGHWVEVNPALGELLGCSSDELVGRGLSELLPERLDDAALRSVLTGEGESGRLTVRGLKGRVRLLDATVNIWAAGHPGANGARFIVQIEEESLLRRFGRHRAP